jgi:hypothetical protein
MRVNREIQRQLCDDHENLTAYRRRLEREQRNQRQRNYGGDMVTRCSRCPPASSCDYCAGVNMARIRAGLLRPREDPTPHANNIIPLPLNNGPYRGARPYTDKTAKKPVVTACLQRSRGGWYRGVGRLNGKNIWVQPRATRDKDAAWAYATEAAENIRLGLCYAEA